MGRYPFPVFKLGVNNHFDNEMSLKKFPSDLVQKKLLIMLVS